MSGFLANGYLPECHVSHVSANDKDANEMILGTAHRSPGISLKTEKKGRKTSARRPPMKAVRPVITSNAVPSLQMRSIGPHSMSGREKEGKKESTGEYYFFKKNSLSYEFVMDITLQSDMDNACLFVVC